MQNNGKLQRAITKSIGNPWKSTQKNKKKKSQQECYGIFLKENNIVSQRERHGGDGYIDLPKFKVYDAIYDRHQELNKSQTASHLDHVTDPRRG